MGLIDINWRPDAKECRRFGWFSLVLPGAIAGAMVYLYALPAPWAIAIGAAGAVVFVLSRIRAELARPVYVGMIVLTYPIGWVFSHLILAVFYYGLLTPIGLTFRLFRRDALQQKWDPSAPSYWHKHRPPDNVRQYFNQF